MKKLSANSDCQRQRLLKCLQERQHGATTLEIIQELDILRPAPRVFELKAQGHNIVTHREPADTALGRHNKVARYVLLPS